MAAWPIRFLTGARHRHLFLVKKIKHLPLLNLNNTADQLSAFIIQIGNWDVATPQ
jgi:hypothetical protein